MKHSITILLLCFALGLGAQSALHISLIDSSYEAVAYQAVVVTNDAIGFKKELLSDDHGKVQLEGLSTSGRYDILVPAGNFYQATALHGIRLISNKTKTVTITMVPTTVTLADVVITADDYQSINALDAEVATELQAKEIEMLPLEGRDITRALYRLPNITQATGFFPEAPNVAINGANALYTNYQIDGMDNNENFLGGQRFAMPVGFTQNITALTNNFSAEHGLSSNGIINITTQSGTNETKGEVFYVVRPGSVLDASSPFAQRDLSGNQVKDGFQRHQVGFALGGAVVPNKTFYFLNAEYTRDNKDNLLNVPQLDINTTVPGTNQFAYLSGKIDHHWSDRFRSSLRTNVGRVSVERQGGGLEGGTAFPSAGSTQQRNALNVALKNTYFGEQFTYEGNYQYGRFNWDYAQPMSQQPNVSIQDASEMTIASIGHPGFTFNSIENAHLLQQKLSLYRDNHRLKMGLQIRSSGFELLGGGNPNGSYVVRLNPTQINGLIESGVGAYLQPADLPSDVEVINYAVELRPTAFEKRQNIYSVFIEDQWTVSPRLNFNIGLRYDYDNLSVGGGDEGDWNNLAPRLSANYSLSENSSIRMGYGIYYDKILYAVYSDARQFNSDSEDYRRQLQALQAQGILDPTADISAITFAGNIAANDPTATYLDGPSAEALQNQREDIFQNELRVLNPNGYDNPYSHQFMVGWQHKIDEQRLFYVDLMHNRSYNLFRLRNLNAPAAYPSDQPDIEARPADEADLTRPVPIYTNDNIGSFAVVNGDTLTGVARNVVMTETAGRSNYYAANFTYEKQRGADRFAYRIMYTLSFLENNTEDINFRAADANDFEAEWGPSINDRTHLINGIFNYFPVDNLTVTLAALIQSGQPINRIPDAEIYGTTDINGDGRSFSDSYTGNNDRSPGESRNSDRLPWASTFDLSAYYQIEAGSGHIEIGAQVFNLFNQENLSGYSNNATQSNQIQTGQAGDPITKRNAAPPRQFQFSLRYLF